MFVHTTSMTTYGGGATLWGFYALGGFGTTSLGSSTTSTRDGASTGHGYISSKDFFYFFLKNTNIWFYAHSICFRA
ncbi:hypothetical protein NY2A_B696R [Paramecium bursaria Chlorella virus NY2A]|uniref:Uncharacterized protein B696R n=1 Tax=Paramecium bursaria Chlorella virus NY2A TaxID=46021 RepID=A7IXM1_PBCVN|nr:hypothetical protein NY2A_B696R [Paramecium bursaria Chlorella virus NY2A]ABT15095.1 hypothetical protein NY2A_B696R [Paramecium bursaria Chlorella virus NY2A]